MSSSCVSLKLAVIQTCSSGMIVISGCPGWMTCPVSADLRLTTPLIGALHGGVLEVELGAADRGLGLLHARRPRTARGPCVAATCSGAGLRRAQVGAGPCCATFDCASRLRATCTASSASRTCERATATSAFDDVGLRHRGVVLLLRHFVLGQQALQALDVALVARGRRLLARHLRARRRQARLGQRRGCAAPLRRTACGLFDAALRRAPRRCSSTWP